jgi:hypothetical protein
MRTLSVCQGLAGDFRKLFHQGLVLHFQLMPALFKRLGQSLGLEHGFRNFIHLAQNQRNGGQNPSAFGKRKDLSAKKEEDLALFS